MIGQIWVQDRTQIKQCYIYLEWKLSVHRTSFSWTKVLTTCSHIWRYGKGLNCYEKVCMHIFNGWHLPCFSVTLVLIYADNLIFKIVICSSYPEHIISNLSFLAFLNYSIRYQTKEYAIEWIFIDKSSFLTISLRSCHC